MGPETTGVAMFAPHPVKMLVEVCVETDVVPWELATTDGAVIGTSAVVGKLTGCSPSSELLQHKFTSIFQLT